MWAGRLFLAPGMFLYLGAGASAESHAHHAVQLIWARDGKLELELPSGAVRVGAALLPANSEHALQAEGQIALLLVEPHGGRGAALDQHARELLGADLRDRLLPLGFPANDLSRQDALEWCDGVLQALSPSRATGVTSRATKRVVDYIETALDGVPRLADAARLVGMSPTRLTHQFSREVGVPFRRFVLWARIKRAVEASRRGLNATEAAMEAGFSDGAHLSRTFKAMFGLAPSMLLPAIEVIGDSWRV